MKTFYFRINILFILLLFQVWFVLFAQNAIKSKLTATSPDKRIELLFEINNGQPFYMISRDDKDIIKPSKLGFICKNSPSLNNNFIIKEKKYTTTDETWTQVWGEVKNIRNHYNELRVVLKQDDKLEREIIIVFRIFNDGVGFRYEFPEQKNLKEFLIMKEETEFVLTDDHKCWWIPAFWYNRYEYLYRCSPLSKIKSDTIRAVHTPFTIETKKGLFLSIHEANLTDYASMTLGVNEKDYTLQCELVPWSDGVRVRIRTPHKTPWRTIQITDDAGGLVTSCLVLNLNEPNRIEDVSWIKPGKYVGIWWGMHIGVYTWNSGDKHGATTENCKRYVDFASKHGFNGVLVEGWNTGWDGNWIENGHLFSFTQAYDDFDIKEVSAYAASKNIKLIGHHETGAAVLNYEKQVEDAFRLYQHLGINTVKTGYVGHGNQIKRLDDNGKIVSGEWHHGQYMVRHYRKIVELAARYGIMLDVHEPVKDTGIRRTFPNMMTREGARGQEYNAWSQDGGNSPEHTTIIPFTRCLAGPFDFTPGIFELYGGKGNQSLIRVRTTLAKQLALYVTIYSPLHMAADLPENYENQPAFQFIKDVPVDWEYTMVPHAKIGDYITVVRKDRNSQDWYLGSITDEERRELIMPLNFLDKDKKYIAQVYMDAEDADWKTNPLAIEIKNIVVDYKTNYKLNLTQGGGTAIRMHPATSEDIKTTKEY